MRFLELMQTFYKYTNIFFYSIKLLIITFKEWDLQFCIKFWTTTKKEIKVKIGKVKFFVRTRQLKSKLADISMIIECVLNKNYNPRGFEIKENDIIIDIGGHIGSFSIYAANIAKNGFVYTYEPFKENYIQLIKNIKLNKIKNIKMFSQAISGKKGKIMLYKDKFNNASNSITKKTNDFIAVDSISLSDIFKLNRLKKCDFLKIDCEGAEYEILLNTSLSTLEKINKIACEYHNPKYFGIRNSKYTIKNLIKYLERTGFHVNMVEVNRYEGFIYAKK